VNLACSHSTESFEKTMRKKITCIILLKIFYVHLLQILFSDSLMFHLNKYVQFYFFSYHTHWRARPCPWKKMLKKNLKKNLRKSFEKKNQIFLAFVTPRLPMSVTKKFQPILSSRLAGYRENIYECLVLFYTGCCNKNGN